jgi:hypothetical protein
MDPCGPLVVVVSPALQCSSLGYPPPLGRHRFDLTGACLRIHRGRRQSGPHPTWRHACLGHRRAGGSSEHWCSKVTLIPTLPPAVAPAGLAEQTPLHVFEDVLCSPHLI